MKTATVRELRNNYSTVLKWVEGGEEVTISRRGKIVARLVPERAKPQRVDWSMSAAARMDRSGFRVLTAKESAELLAEAGRQVLNVKAVCCDTSFLYSAYAVDPHTDRALREMSLLRRPLSLSILNVLEMENAFRLARFRGLLQPSQLDLVLTTFETDCRAGRLLVAPLDLERVAAETRRLSVTYTSDHGHRLFDIMLVAAALCLDASEFWTFDSNQRKLASAEGLRVNR